jgi:hypothetical protein
MLGARGSTVLPVVLVSALGACGGDGGGDDDGAGADADIEDRVAVSGAIQKGPFILGAQVQVNVLDAAGDPTGAVFNTTTTNDKGEFSVTVEPSVVELVTEGFYYNEATWSLSAAPISMRALAELDSAGAQQIYVNAVTHMARPRALSLYAGGAELSDAVAQAETELASAFPLVAPASLAPGTAMNALGGDDDSNAYSLAMSCLVAQVAQWSSDGADVDAQLQQLINNVASDLADDGVVAEFQIVDFDPYECVASLQRRLADIGATAAELPDPQRVLDLDRDGDPNRTDPDGDGDGVDAADDPVIAVAGTGNDLLVVTGGSGRAIQLIGRHPNTGAPMYGPLAAADESGTLTDVVDAIPAFGGIVIRRSGGEIHLLAAGADNAAPLPIPGFTGSAAWISAAHDGALLVVDPGGDVFRVIADTSTALPISNAARVAGSDADYVVLDVTGAVRIVEDAAVTDVLGLDGIVIVDVAVDIVGADENGYLAISDAGAMYRFSAAAPTAVEDTAVTGITSLHLSTGRLLAVTDTGIWDLAGGAGSQRQIADVGGFTSVTGPIAWEPSGVSIYAGIDADGDVQLIERFDDLTIGTLYRPVYVPR